MMVKYEYEEDENMHKREGEARVMLHTRLEIYTTVPWSRIFSRATAGENKIDGFLNKCLEFYLDAEADSKLDKTRYLYEPVVKLEKPGRSSMHDEAADDRLVYKRYTLSDTKVSTFHS